MKPGERIKEFRLSKELNQKEFSDKMGYSHAYLSDIERTKVEPSREFLKKLAQIYGISIDYILYGKEDLRSIVREQEIEYGAAPNMERRRPENVPKRKFIDKVLRIVDSGNDTVIKALRSNVEAFLLVVEAKKSEFKEGD